jgi:cation-transporting P family ATPase
VAPVALALSTSLAMRFGIEKSARRGVLVRNGDTMRELVDVNAIIFNRVGTLSQGDMTVETVTAARGENPELVLRVAGALAMESRHPVSRALVRASREARDAGTGGEEVPHWIDVSHAHITKDGSYTGLIEIPLKNGDGDIEMRQVDATLWRPRDLSSLEGKLATAATSGGTPLVVSWKHKPRGVITLYDSVKDDAANAVADLEKMGVETVMLSRDTYPVARRFADNLGISKVLAGIALGKKEIAVRSVHARGANVALVGETSVLDCMRVADVGILMGNPESLGFAEADVVVLRDDVSSIPELFGLARRVTAVADRNIMFAWVYNVVAMSLSVMGVVHPMAATIMMIGSSLVIETLSNRVRRF